MMPPHVRYWPLSDIRLRSADVCFWGKSGHLLYVTWSVPLGAGLLSADQNGLAHPR
jgi:hypothetical protein